MYQQEVACDEMSVRSWFTIFILFVDDPMFQFLFYSPSLS